MLRHGTGAGGKCSEVEFIVDEQMHERESTQQSTTDEEFGRLAGYGSSGNWISSRGKVEDCPGAFFASFFTISSSR